MIKAAKVRFEMKSLKVCAIGHTPQGFGFGRALDNDLLETFGVRQDAIEARELAQQEAAAADELSGVDVKTEETSDYFLTHVRILSEEGSRLMGKPKGDYITLESEMLKENATECHEKIIKILAENIHSLVEFEKDACVLVAGLGNWNITPDALGPKVVSKILVTRHLQGTLPEEIEESVRPVAAVSPGVMGITGIVFDYILRTTEKKVVPWKGKL
jgi:spore protease